MTPPERRFAPVTVRRHWNGVRYGLEPVSDIIGIRTGCTALARVYLDIVALRPQRVRRARIIFWEHVRSENGPVYVWHHLDFDPISGEGTLQLVGKDAHNATLSHSGGVADYEAYYGVDY
jgi:hypothetical protein